MVKLIVGVVVLVALGVLIILNVNYKSPLNLFGAQLSNVSVVVIAIVSFLLGIIYSLLVSVVNRIRRGRKNNPKKAPHDPDVNEAAAAPDNAAAAGGARQKRT